MRFHERTGDRAALEEALKLYRAARDIWAQMAESARGVYVADITVGELAVAARPLARPAAGHRRRYRRHGEAARHPRSPNRGGRARKGRHRRRARTPRARTFACSHTPEPHLRDKEPLYVELKAPQTGSARLWYRHFNQAERWQTTEMLPLPDSDRFRASIDASFAQSPYPVQYYFEVRLSAEKVWLYPGFDASRSNQPYYVVRPL